MLPPPIGRAIRYSSNPISSVKRTAKKQPNPIAILRNTLCSFEVSLRLMESIAKETARSGGFGNRVFIPARLASKRNVDVTEHGKEIG